MPEITPHIALTVTRPDEAAECWDGVLDSGLYGKLWGCTHLYTDIDRENCGPSDVVGVNSIASFWSTFDDETKLKLNELAEKQDFMHD